MPSSGELTGKRKGSDSSLPPPKRHQPHPKNNLQNRIRGPLKWFLRSRKNIIEETKCPSTSSNKEKTLKKDIKRKTVEKVNNVQSKSKQSRIYKEGNGSNKTKTPMPKMKELRRSERIKGGEKSEETAGVNDNGESAKIIAKPEHVETTQVIKKSQSLEAAPKINMEIHPNEERIPSAANTTDELSENVNHLTENKSDTVILTSDEIQNKITSKDGNNHENSQEGDCEVKEVMEEMPSTKEEEVAVLEFNERMKEDEELSKEEIKDEKIESETGKPSTAQESSSEESCAANLPGANSSVPGFSVLKKSDILLKTEEKPKENIMQRNPCLGSCEEAEQHHWKAEKVLRMENEEDECCKSTGGMLGGVGLSEHAAPPLPLLQEIEEWTDEDLRTLLDNPQTAQPPFPITLNEMDMKELERLLDLCEENN